MGARELNPFTLEVLQAINDWQRGGSHAQKVKRGNKLKEIAQGLQANLRSFSGTCYRQEAHEKDRVWQLLVHNTLPETIAAWTSDLSIAKNIKGGVPPPGLQGVIFAIDPPVDSVILNLSEVYNDPRFATAVTTHRSKIVGFGIGIGKYSASQKEIVLELGSLDPAALHIYGGFSNNRAALAEQYFRRPPSPQDLQDFDALWTKAGIPSGGDWWLSPQGTQNVIARMAPVIPAFRAWKAKLSAVKTP